MVRAIWKGEEVVLWGERMRVPRGVNSRGFLMMILENCQRIRVAIRVESEGVTVCGLGLSVFGVCV